MAQDFLPHNSQGPQRLTTDLHRAVQANDFAQVRQILADPSSLIQLNQIDNDDLMPLAYVQIPEKDNAAGFDENAKNIALALINAGADVNAICSYEPGNSTYVLIKLAKSYHALCKPKSNQPEQEASTA